MKNVELLLAIINKAVENKTVEIFEKEFPDCWISERDRGYYNKEIAECLPIRTHGCQCQMLNPVLRDDYNKYKFACEYLVGEKLSKILIADITIETIKDYIL